MKTKTFFYFSALAGSIVMLILQTHMPFPFGLITGVASGFWLGKITAEALRV